MSEIRDLDLLAGEPIQVRLAGHTYLLPADCPIPVVLRTEALGKRLRESSEDPSEDDLRAHGDATRELYDALLGLFRVHQPDLAEIPLSTVQMLTFIPVVYGGAGQPDGEDDAAPPPAQKKSGPKSRKR